MFNLHLLMFMKNLNLIKKDSIIEFAETLRVTKPTVWSICRKRESITESLIVCLQRGILFKVIIKWSNQEM